VSLIFEALKKLDREKKAPERGFLVVGGAPVAGESRLRAPALLLLLAAAGGGGFLIARALRPAAAPAPVASSTPPTTLAAADAPPRLAPPVPLPPESPAPAPEARPSASQPAPSPGPAARPEAAATPVPAVAAPAFALQAVAEQEGHPVAIVNGQLVRVGDSVDGARVLRITPEEVELEQGGRRLVLTF
jgi:hypothetical protein